MSVLSAFRPAVASMALACIVSFPLASVAADIGQTAPAFTLKDLGGKDRSLAEFKGKTVVLEWNNPNCPFVQKHYDSMNMQKLQKEFGARDVVWLTVNSTSLKASDFMDPAALVKWEAEKSATPRAYLMDPTGSVGKAYGAKTTPHMYVIDPAGKLVFAGGIDDKRSTDVADVKSARNHVKAALDETLAGRPVSTSSATPYGCSVKYAS